MEGDSFRRQTALAQRYAADNGLDLDESLTFHDLGVSAYRGANAEAGRLADFKEAVRIGLVPKGSYLLVEALDRLSRLTPRKALRVLEEIIELDIVVVTMNDGKQYTLESIESDPLNLMIAILYFIRANEESATKGRRIKAAWEGKRLKAATHPLTSVCPAWLTLDKVSNVFVVDEEKAQVVRGIFDRINAGTGLELIARELNEEGKKPFGRGVRWYRSYIQKIRDNPAVVGTFIPHHLEHSATGKVRRPLEPLHDYFPAIVDSDVFHAAKAMAQGKAPTTKRSTGIRSIVAGLASCPHCGGTMTRVTKGSKSKAGHPYLICTSAKQGRSCDYHAVRLAKVEDVIRNSLSEILKSAPLGDVESERARQEAQGVSLALHDEVEGILSAIAQRPVPALLNRLEELEEQRDRANARVKELEASALLGNQRLVTNRAERLLELIDSDDADITQINALLRQLFTRVVVDYDQGNLHFHWQQGEVSTMSYEW